MPAGATELLRVEKVSREFQGHRVLDGLDLGLEPGQRLAMTGANGSGKSTLLRCIAGSLIPSSGEILVAGHRAGTLEARTVTGVSLAQERSFYLRLTGRANLRFFGRLRDRSHDGVNRQIEALEEELALQEILRERSDRCSTGMMQQLAFARALLGNPRLLLLDEPTRSLDKEATERIWAALDRRPDLAVVIATHRDDDVRRCGSLLELPLRS
jgi:ABC-2 type transport system ATP-binding protein